MENFRYNARPVKAQANINLNSAVADFGGIWIDDTTLRPIAPATTYGWCEILVITATVLAAGTKSNIENINGKTLPAGSRIPGIFSQIVLTSGSIIAFNSVPQS